MEEYKGLYTLTVLHSVSVFFNCSCTNIKIFPAYLSNLTFILCLFCNILHLPKSGVGRESVRSDETRVLESQDIINGMINLILTDFSNVAKNLM